MTLKCCRYIHIRVHFVTQLIWIQGTTEGIIQQISLSIMVIIAFLFHYVWEREMIPLLWYIVFYFKATNTGGSGDLPRSHLHCFIHNSGAIPEHSSDKPLFGIWTKQGGRNNTFPKVTHACQCKCMCTPTEVSIHVAKKQPLSHH